MIEDNGHSYFENYPHYYRLEGTDGKFAYLLCQHCGHLRKVINPEYVNYYTKKLRQENEEKLVAKTPDKVTYTGVDTEHIRQGFDQYEGNLRKDLLQPFLNNGSRNPDFIKAYGESIYESLTPNVQL